MTLIVVSCGGASSEISSDQGAPSDPQPTAVAAGSAAESTEPEPAAPRASATDVDPTQPAGTSSTPSLASVINEEWSALAIGEGTKPVLAIGPDDQPGIAFLFENLPEGFVAYASAKDDWAVESLVEGYFYGPIGLAYDLDGRPNIVYHDHQDATFQQNLGDLTLARREADGWEVTAAPSQGHDGWDSTVVVGGDGIVRAAGIDPSQFGSSEGLEYYELIDDVWQVEAIGTGPLEYEWNVDLRVRPDGSPGVTYFKTDSQDLIYSQREGNVWTPEVVAADGDVGRFSALDYDAEGFAHISYWNASTNEVWYASNSSGGWVTEAIDELSSVQVGFEGARRITSIALTEDATPYVAYSDVTGIWLAIRGPDGTWVSEKLVDAGARPLGQLVSLAIDADAGPHLAFFEVTGNAPLSGVVAYLSPSA